MTAIPTASKAKTPDAIQVPDALNSEQKKKLAKHEKEIRDGLDGLNVAFQKHYFVIAKALIAIRDAELFRPAFGSIHAYAMATFDMEKSRVTHLIQGLGVMEDLTAAKCKRLPENEGQCRELYHVKKDKGAKKLVEVWNKHAESGAKTTALNLKKAIRPQAVKPKTKIFPKNDGPLHAIPDFKYTAHVQFDGCDDMGTATKGCGKYLADVKDDDKALKPDSELDNGPVFVLGTSDPREVLGRVRAFVLEHHPDFIKVEIFAASYVV